MTRIIKKNRLLLAAGCMAMIFIGSTSTVFADEASTPVELTVPATSISFNVTEKVNMTGTAGSTDLTVDSLTVENTGDIGVLTIDSIALTGESEWSVVTDDTDFTKVAKDSKQFSLTADGTHDMVAAYTSAGEVNPGESDVTTFTGKTGIVSAQISNTQVGNLVTTVSFK